MDKLPYRIVESKIIHIAFHNSRTICGRIYHSDWTVRPERYNLSEALRVAAESTKPMCKRCLRRIAKRDERLWGN